MNKYFIDNCHQLFVNFVFVNRELRFLYTYIPYRTNGHSPLGKTKRVFQALLNFGVEELCEVANSLITPVRLGVARPTAHFSLSGSSLDVFSVSFTIVYFKITVYCSTPYDTSLGC